MKRVLYIQYTNPGGYPPLEHSSRILADAGWDVVFLGTGAAGANALVFPPHPRITVRRMAFQQPGWRQKAHYLRYCLWVIGTVLWWRPRWVYASDALVCPVAALLTYLQGVSLIYHEHDAPPDKPGDGFFSKVLQARRTVARRARLCIIPNGRRLAEFETKLGPLQASACVWNCPRTDEVLPPRSPVPGRCVLAYHGSLVPARLPRTVLEALALLPDWVTLRITGYETVGARGYLAELQELGKSLGVSHRIELRGTLPLRSQLMQGNADADIGLSLTPMRPDDPNFFGMAGASNKAFDYMACGMAVLVSDIPDWKELFVEPGYGLAANPDDPKSIAAAIGWLANRPAERSGMGEAGRQRILSAWNYEAVFAPALALMSAGMSAAQEG